MQPASATALLAVPSQRRKAQAAQEAAMAATKEAASRLQPASWPSVRTSSASPPAPMHHSSVRGPTLNSTAKPAAATAPKAT